MADEKQLTAEEIILGLRTALQYYANPNQNQGHDLCKDEESHNYNESGECARQALEKYQFVETLHCVPIKITVDDITIISGVGRNRWQTQVYFDGKFQRGLQAVKFEADLKSRPMVTITRVPLPDDGLVVPDLPPKENA